MLETLKFGRYLRKSSEEKDRQVLSIESQRNEMKDLAKTLKIKILKEFIDEGSGHKPNERAGFSTMIKAIEAGDINALLVWKADRLARNPIEGGYLLYLLQNGVLRCIKTPYNTYLPTDNTLPLTIEFGMANQFSLDLSRNVKRGNKTKIEKGGFCHVAPIGYLNDRINKTIIKDPERFDQVRKMWNLLLTDMYSLSEICEIANKEWGFRTMKRKKTGGVKLRISSLYKMFNNRFYYGYIRSGNNKGWGNHLAMVTENEFERGQEILRKRGRKTKSNKEFPFTGLIKCRECDCKITAEEKVKYVCPNCGKHQSGKNPKPCLRCKKKITREIIANGKWYTYYHCTKKKGDCKQPSIRGKDLKQQIDQILQSIEIDADFEKWSIKWLKFLNEEKFCEKKKENTMFQRNYNQAEEKLKRLIEMRAEGEITKEQFFKMKEETQLECNQWKQRFQKAEVDRDEWLKEAEREIDFVLGISNRFDEGTIKEKRYIFSKVGSNFTLEDGVLALDIGKEYLAFKKLEKLADLRIEPPILEPHSVSEKRLNKATFRWWAIVDSNH